MASYVRVLLTAEAWCEQHHADLRTAPHALIREWAETVPFTTSSRRMARSALVHYWRIHGRENPPLHAVRVPRKARGICRALEPDEATLLAKSARNRGDRQGAATLIALHLALRRFEVAKLRWADFEDGGWLRIVGKREQSAMLPVHNDVTMALAEMGRSDNVWVFPGRFGGPVAPATVWTWIKLVAAEAGVAAMTTHRARHTALATALDATGDLRAVADFARHADPATTMIYTRTSERRLRSVMDAIDYG